MEFLNQTCGKFNVQLFKFGRVGNICLENFSFDTFTAALAPIKILLLPGNLLASQAGVCGFMIEVGPEWLLLAVN